LRAEAAGLPRCTVMFLGMITLSSTRGVQFSTGCAPLPPLPANKGCGGMTMGAFGMSLPSSVTGIIAGCPAKIWMPSMRTVR
jgi:hypothetical protein